jgi:hypothetical protein
MLTSEKVIEAAFNKLYIFIWYFNVENTVDTIMSGYITCYQERSVIRVVVESVV